MDATGGVDAEGVVGEVLVSGAEGRGGAAGVGLGTLKVGRTGVVGTTNFGGGASEVGATAGVATDTANRIGGAVAAGLDSSGVPGPLSGAFAGASGCCLLMIAFSTSPGFEI